MDGMAKRSSISWRSRLVPITAGVGLVALVGVAAALLVPRNIQIGQDVWSDAQTDEQTVTSWRGAAVLASTSGSAVGDLCALLAGLSVARWRASRTRWSGLLTAVLAGAGLGLVDLATAFRTAAPRLRELTRSPLLTREDGTAIVDPGLRHHGCVLAAMVVAFVIFLIAAGIGFGLCPGRLTTKLTAVAVSVVLAPVVHYVTMMALVLRPGFFQ
jgi:hypothetical protein